jgi:hypothetical protein
LSNTSTTISGSTANAAAPARAFSAASSLLTPSEKPLAGTVWPVKRAIRSS